MKAIDLTQFIATDMAIHKILLGAGLVIVENPCNLATLQGKGFNFSCLPLRIKDSEGSPVRAVGMLPE
ncbi:MAG: hypothetical protein ABIJ86_09030 [Spirochaetota bacterium]